MPEAAAAVNVSCLRPSSEEELRHLFSSSGDNGNDNERRGALGQALRGAREIVSQSESLHTTLFSLPEARAGMEMSEAAAAVDVSGLPPSDEGEPRRLPRQSLSGGDDGNDAEGRRASGQVPEDAGKIVSPMESFDPALLSFWMSPSSHPVTQPWSAPCTARSSLVARPLLAEHSTEASVADGTPGSRLRPYATKSSCPARILEVERIESLPPLGWQSLRLLRQPARLPAVFAY